MDASSQHMDPVVVGVNSSDGARDAAGWAADLAASWGAPLHLVHVVPERPALIEVPPWLGELQDAVGRGAAEPQATILWGVPAYVLANRAVGARMLVLGSCRDEAGSVAVALLDRVTCPVAVVRGPTPQAAPPGSGPVVVGVDGSAAGRAALDFAADLAGSWAAPLVAVHARADAVAGIRGGVRHTEDPETPAAQAGARWGTELDAVAQARPDLTVQRELVEGTPVQALLDRADGARVLVVGHQGDTAWDMQRSSTSRTLVELAPCPVVVTSPVNVPAGQAPTARGVGWVR